MDKDEMDMMKKIAEEQARTLSPERLDLAQKAAMQLTYMLLPINASLREAKAQNPRLGRKYLEMVVLALIQQHTLNIDDAVQFVSEIRKRIENIDKEINTFSEDKR